jgi:hypothetical protein
MMFLIFGFASPRQENASFWEAESLQPLLYIHRLDFGKAARAPAWKHPLPQVTVVGYLRGVGLPVFFRRVGHRLGLVENVRQLVLAVMVCQRLEADVLDELLWGLLVDLEANRIHRGLRR